jgi:transcriptional regulator with XRE-family HTH domain
VAAWKPSHKSRGVDLDTLAECLAEARAALGETEDALGARIGVDGRTVKRWERAEASPSRQLRLPIVDALSGIAVELFRDLVQSLGLSYEAMLARHPGQKRAADEAAAAAARPPASAGPASDSSAAQPARAVAPATADPRAVLDDAVRTSAEHLDVTAKRLRLVFAALLADVERLGLTTSAARDIVLGRATQAPAAPAEGI